MKVAYKKATSNRKPFTITDITTNEKMNFYTGITSIAIFEACVCDALTIDTINNVLAWNKESCFSNCATKEKQKDDIYEEINSKK